MTDASGAVDGNGIQVAYQLADICAISSYSFVVSAVILLVMKYIPGLDLRVDEDAEIRGLDQHEFYMEEVGDWSAAEKLGMGILGLSAPGTPPAKEETEAVEKK